MPIFKIETIIQSRATYFIEAPDEESAKDAIGCCVKPALEKYIAETIFSSEQVNPKYVGKWFDREGIELYGATGIQSAACSDH